MPQPWELDIRGDQLLPLITTDAPVLRVQAGPGTGKTFGLRRRILRLLHPQGNAVAAADILVCSFNRVIADDLRKEIQAELQAHGLDVPKVSTIHALCTSLTGEHGRFLLPQETEAMIYDVRHGFPAIDQQYGNSQYAVLRALREHESGIASHGALKQAVEQWLADHAASLVSDLPRTVARRLADGDFADTRYRHIIIDEFQDLTETEARIAVGLLAEEGSLVVLGDRKQSIYAFRGNDQRGLDALPELVAGPILDHTMDECRRCRSEVVRLANAVVEIYEEPLVDAEGPGAQIHHVYASTPATECKQLAEHIIRAYRARPDEKHLVLATRKRWGYDLRSAIREIDPTVPTHTVFSEDILETWPVREAFMFLSIVADESDAVALRDWVSYREPNPEGTGFKAPERNAGAYLNLLRNGGSLTVTRVRNLVADAQANVHGSGATHVKKRLRRLIELLDRAPDDDEVGHRIDALLDPERWITNQGDRAELARQDLDRLRVEVKSLVAEHPDMDLAGIVRSLRYKIAKREAIGEEHGGGIKIVTLWGAKGLTADYVYVLGLVDEALPGTEASEGSGLTPGEHLAEQLRLLYVTLTRAKKALVISRSQSIRWGDVPALQLRRPANGNRHWAKLTPCQFFRDVPRELLPNAVRYDEWAGISMPAE